jgi:malonate decarboxylase alpha subunit
MTAAVLPQDRIVPALEALIMPADRIVLEGDNQKQAVYLSRHLANVDPTKVHDLHLVISSNQPARASHVI